MSAIQPVVVVTGANGGVGFGICHRFLVQLARKSPTDVQDVYKSAANAGSFDIIPEGPHWDGLTIVMACRSVKRAEIARDKLYAMLDAEVEQQKAQPNYDGYAETFRENVKLEVHYLDLSIMKSIFDFGVALARRYPYVSHLICNAGLASFSKIDIWLFIKQLLTSPMSVVLLPEYHIQRIGERSADGLGWIWQSNVFGHYALFRVLQPLLQASPHPLEPRVLWMSSNSARSRFFEPDDLQLVKTKTSYEASKYQIDLIATHLNRRSLQAGPGSKPVCHLIVDPGIVVTNIAVALVNVLTHVVYVLGLYMARILGSPFYTITPYKAAISAVQLSFIPVSSLAALLFPTPANLSRRPSGCDPSCESVQIRPLRFLSITDRYGNEGLRFSQVDGWKENEGACERILEQCEQLYQSSREANQGSND